MDKVDALDFANEDNKQHSNGNYVTHINALKVKDLGFTLGFDYLKINNFILRHKFFFALAWDLKVLNMYENTTAWPDHM